MKRKPFYLLLGYTCYRFPSIGCRLWSVFDHIEREKYRFLRHASNKFSDKSPTQVVYINPNSIIYYKKTFSFDQMGGRVIGGDWDRERMTFEDNDVYQCLKQRYNEGYDWDDIEYVNQCMEAVQNGQTVWQMCTTVEDIRKQCADVDDLYQSIQEHGILEPTELLNQGKHARPYNIPKVNIGRDGELILNSDGTHRTALAKIIGVNQMPIWISVRHKNWQAIRDRAAAGEPIPSKYQGHPDLDDLI